MVLPALINIRYNASPKLLFLGGIRYNSRSYRLNIEELDDTIYHLNHSEIRTTLIMEKQLTNWVWIDATIGYQFNFSTDFNAPNNPDASFQVEPGMSPFIKFGVFISPPSSVRNK